jgi:DNA-binding MarR family transcriptional regulator
VTIDQAIERVQFSYPQVYYACHTRHERRRSSASRLSARDAELLVHLDRSAPTTLSELARHMDLARSTLSEAVSALETLGYVTKSGAGVRDRRHVAVVLTTRGVDAVRSSSVLETWRLGVVLGRLAERDRAAAVRGLDLLARASRPAPSRKGR